MARDNPRWGYPRIRGALDNLGLERGRNTIKRILLEHGIEPAPERAKRMPWKTFLKSHWGQIAAADFFTVEVLTLEDHRYFIVDRDPLFTRELRGILEQRGVQTVRLPARSPNLHAFAERFVLTIESECLNHIVPRGERHLRRAVSQFVEHYHLERHHQGLGNGLIAPPAEPANENAPIECSERLGGLLEHYYRAA